VSTAYLDDVALPFGPNTLSWGYKLRTVTTDTLGGRVIQILGVQMEDLSFQAYAGDRKRLIEVATEVERIMEKHIATGGPVQLLVPSRGLDFQVYVRSLPSVDFKLNSVGYPYTLRLKVDFDNTEVSRFVIRNELKNLSAGIGYTKGWSGGDLSEQELRESGGLEPEVIERLVRGLTGLG